MAPIYRAWGEIGPGLMFRLITNGNLMPGIAKCGRMKRFRYNPVKGKAGFGAEFFH